MARVHGPFQYVSQGVRYAKFIGKIDVLIHRSGVRYVALFDIAGIFLPCIPPGIEIPVIGSGGGLPFILGG